MGKLIWYRTIGIVPQGLLGHLKKYQYAEAPRKITKATRSVQMYESEPHVNGKLKLAGSIKKTPTFIITDNVGMELCFLQIFGSAKVTYISHFVGQKIQNWPKTAKKNISYNLFLHASSL